MGPAIGLLRRDERPAGAGDRRSAHSIAVVIEERIDDERRTNSLIVSSGYSGDGDDSL